MTTATSRFNGLLEPGLTRILYETLFGREAWFQTQVPAESPELRPPVAPVPALFRMNCVRCGGLVHEIHAFTEPIAEIAIAVRAHACGEDE